MLLASFLACLIALDERKMSQERHCKVLLLVHFPFMCSAIGLSGSIEI